MTTSQRRARARKANAVAAGITRDYLGDTARRMGLTENPNTGKRHGRNVTARGNLVWYDRDGQEGTRKARGMTRAELDRIDAARHDYRPLTVSTPIKRARIAPKVTSYTI